MSPREEFEYAEILVDRLLLESFANEQSPYYNPLKDSVLSERLDKFRGKLKFHINNSLSPRQKEVMKHYLSGKKEREIASLLGITQQVVNIYKHRAIKKLHKILMA